MSVLWIIAFLHLYSTVAVQLKQKEPNGMEFTEVMLRDNFVAYLFITESTFAAMIALIHVILHLLFGLISWTFDMNL